MIHKLELKQCRIFYGGTWKDFQNVIIEISSDGELEVYNRVGETEVVFNTLYSSKEWKRIDNKIERNRYIDEENNNA